MNQFRFLEWKIYKDSQALFSLILKITKKLPKEYRFEIGAQVVRSALSVVLNVAEGSGKKSDKELSRYLDIALGSLYETLACIDTCRIESLVSPVDFESVKSKVIEIANQIGGFKKKIDRSL